MQLYEWRGFAKHWYHGKKDDREERVCACRFRSASVCVTLATASTVAVLTLKQNHYMTTANVSAQADSWHQWRGLTQERSLSIMLEVSRRWPEADSSPICKPSVFIYLLLNDLRFKPRGHSCPSAEKNTFFSCPSFVTGPSNSRTGLTLNGNFTLHLRDLCLWKFTL